MAHIEHRAAHFVVAALVCWSVLQDPAASAAESETQTSVEDAVPPAGNAAPAPGAAEEAAPLADGPPVYLAVTGVRSDDVLHLRNDPSADSKSLADIPPDARGLRKIGCMRIQLSMDRYMYMSKEERRDAQLPWCRVEYKGTQGWVAARYVTEEGTAKR